MQVHCLKDICFQTSNKLTREEIFLWLLWGMVKSRSQLQLKYPPILWARLKLEDLRHQPSRKKYLTKSKDLAMTQEVDTLVSSLQTIVGPRAVNKPHQVSWVVEKFDSTIANDYDSESVIVWLVNQCRKMKLWLYYIDPAVFSLLTNY